MRGEVVEGDGGGKGFGAQTRIIRLLKNMFFLKQICFPLLVSNGIHHHWTFFSRGRKSKWKVSGQIRILPEEACPGPRAKKHVRMSKMAGLQAGCLFLFVYATPQSIQGRGDIYPGTCR